MDVNAKVQLTEAWWKANKAVTLRDTAKLGPALGAYETALVAASVPAKGVARAKALGALKAAVLKLEEARDGTARACGKLHGETKTVLENQFQEAVGKADDSAVELIKEFDRSFTGQTAKAVIGDRSLRSYWLEYASQPMMAELGEYTRDILIGDKIGAASYAKFIPESAPKQLNLPRSTVQKFEAVAEANGDLGDVDLWKEVRSEILKMCEKDQHFSTKFRDWTWKTAGYNPKKLGL